MMTPSKHVEVWMRIQQRKAEYIDTHQEMTPTAYEAEMKRIADECGA